MNWTLCHHCKLASAKSEEYCERCARNLLDRVSNFGSDPAPIGARTPHIHLQPSGFWTNRMRELGVVA